MPIEIIYLVLLVSLFVTFKGISESYMLSKKRGYDMDKVRAEKERLKINAEADRQRTFVKLCENLHNNYESHATSHEEDGTAVQYKIGSADIEIDMSSRTAQILTDDKTYNVATITDVKVALREIEEAEEAEKAKFANLLPEARQIKAIEWVLVPSSNGCVTIQGSLAGHRLGNVDVYADPNTVARKIKQVEDEILQNPRTFMVHLDGDALYAAHLIAVEESSRMWTHYHEMQALIKSGQKCMDREIQEAEGMANYENLCKRQKALAEGLKKMAVQKGISPEMPEVGQTYERVVCGKKDNGHVQIVAALRLKYIITTDPIKFKILGQVEDRTNTYEILLNDEIECRAVLVLKDGDIKFHVKTLWPSTQDEYFEQWLALDEIYKDDKTMSLEELTQVIPS